jgi:hypothetical protein
VKSLLDIERVGCTHLNGMQALELVRARHLQYAPPGTNLQDKVAWPYDPQSDLSRIVRDHMFLRILASTVESKGLSNPITVNDLIGAVINQITIDPGLKGQLINLVTHYRHLNPSTVPQLTLPITTVGGYHYAGSNIGDVDFPVQPADNKVIAAWSGTALAAPVKPAGVNVVNITSTPQLATDIGSKLAAAGLHVLSTTSATVPATVTETLVHYHPGQVADALSVMRHLAGAVMLQSDASIPAGQVEVDAGTALEVIGLPTAGSATTTTTPAAATSTTAPHPITTVPTPGGQSPSSSTDVLQPWDPRPCI